nr:glycosyltransferase 61 family protein [Gluconobacter sp. Dm-62]
MQNSKAIFNNIRQCRPDRVYGTNEYRNIGFYNKNRTYIYKSYCDQEAERFLLENFGEYIASVYNGINIPQAKSDFFLVASLYCEGGISADVCSTCTSLVDQLIKDQGKLHLVLESNEFQKKFLYAAPKNPVVKKYLEFLISKYEEFSSRGEQIYYDLFSSQKVFDGFVKQALENNLLNGDDFVVIDRDAYRAVIDNDLSEEVLLDFPAGSRKKYSVRGVVDRDSDFSSAGFDRIIGAREGVVLDKSSNYEILGEDKHPSITIDLRDTIGIPNLELYNINDVTISGHGCVWKGDTFLKLESYLSNVSEGEMEAGFWKSPSELPPVSYVEDDVIVAFGAGYGCYGHYLVDEIPRLALAKTLLGAESFGSKKILVTSDTPEWGVNLLKFFLDIEESNIINFDHKSESINIKSSIIPNYVHKSYNFHPFMKEFFGYVKNDNPQRVPHRRICLSRKAWEPQKLNQRVFLQQEEFEEMAKSRGFEIISPENLSLEDQVTLLRETRCQIGEHGSAQHASIYNPRGATVGTINPLTEIQCNLGRIYNDRNIITFADQETNDDKNNKFFSLEKSKLVGFFDKVEEADEKRIYEGIQGSAFYFDKFR